MGKESPRQSGPSSLILGPRPRWVIHPSVFVVAYVLNTALANEVSPAGYVRALLVGAILAAMLAVAAWIVVRNRWDAALLASTILLVAISPVTLAWVLIVLRTAIGPWLGTLVVAGTLIGSLGLVGARLLRAWHGTGRLPRPAPETMNLVSLAFLGAVIASHAFSGSLPVSPHTPPPVGWDPAAANKPDIFVLLLDGYPRSDVLERRFGVDDSAFLQALRSRGFEVATTNHSNYTLTELTFASMFQMRYIDQIPSLKPVLGTGRQENAALRDAAEAGQVFSILRAAGYELTMSFGGWEHVALRRAADTFIDTGELSDFERSVVHRTWFLYPIDLVWPNLFTDSQRNRIVHGFDALDQFATTRAEHPRFLFLHIPAPHLPPVVEADGTPRTLRASQYEATSREGYGMTDLQYRDAWQGEVDYLAERVMKGIDAILRSQSGREAVIIVMSDHGYGFELHPDDTQSRLGNLFAARTPGPEGLFAHPPTPVNLFTVLFNQYLSTQLARLPDRFFLHGERQMDLMEVSDPDQVPQP